MRSRPILYAIFGLLLLLLPRPGQAGFLCSGLDDSLNTSATPAAFYSASTATWSVWFKPTGTAQNVGSSLCSLGEHVFHSVATNGGVYTGLFRHNALNPGPNDRLCGLNYSGGTPVDVQVAYTPTAWAHLTLVHNGGNLTLYKDGTQVSTVASGTTDDVTGFLTLCHGQDAVNDSKFPGQGEVGEAALYPTARSAQQIMHAAKSRLRRQTAGASGYWPLSGCPAGTNGHGVTFRDHSGNSRPMTGDTGNDGVGATCTASNHLMYPAGVE